MINLSVDLATPDLCPVIQNMGRFYVYEASRDCGFTIGEDGLYEDKDYKSYFDDPLRKAFIVKVNHELAGFVLLNKISTLPETDWNIGEFFILAKFQNKGIGKEVAHRIWQTHPGKWEVSVIPENKTALIFWRKTISAFANGDYHEETKNIDYDKVSPKRVVFSFEVLNGSEVKQ